MEERLRLVQQSQLRAGITELGKLYVADAVSAIRLCGSLPGIWLEKLRIASGPCQLSQFSRCSAASGISNRNDASARAIGTSTTWHMGKLK